MTKAELDIAGKKGLLRLVFKSIKVEDSRIRDFEPYEPFESLYEGAKVKCQLKETQKVVTISENVSISGLSDVR